MSSPFKVALIGRPNVGKSALFNRICQKRLAIVDAEEGVTRDRHYAAAEYFGTPFLIVDTGGIDPKSRLPFADAVKKQAEEAIAEADALILVVDGQSGLTSLDCELATLLLRTKKPLCLAINKIDDLAFQATHLYPFHKLGIKRLISVSASHNWQIAELLEAALPASIMQKTKPDQDVDEGIEAQGETSRTIHLALVGRPNVGKSSLVNSLLQEERCIVSPLPGTTRDSIDTAIQWENTPFVLIDTAGVRRKRAEHEPVDKFAAIRTQEAMSRADVCLLLLDAERGLTSQDKKIAKEIEELGKGCVILFNKWDLVKGYRMEHCLKSIEEQAPFLHHCPKLFISAKMGRNLDKIWPLAIEVYEEWSRRLTTGQLNKCIGDAMQKTPPPMLQGKRLRVYYSTQITTSPPTFLLFVNYPHLMNDTYKKYLSNQLRLRFGFSGAPLLLQLKARTRRALTKEAAEPLEHPWRRGNKGESKGEEWDAEETEEDFDDNEEFSEEYDGEEDLEDDHPF